MTTPGVTRAEGCSCTFAYRPSRSTQPSTASWGCALRRTTSRSESDGDQQGLQDAEGDDARGHARESGLEPADGPQPAPGRRSTRPMAADTITAPSTAEGRYDIGVVRNRSTKAMVPAATSPAICVRAPIWSFTAVRDPLAPSGSPA